MSLTDDSPRIDLTLDGKVLRLALDSFGRIYFQLRTPTLVGIVWKALVAESHRQAGGVDDVTYQRAVEVLGPVLDGNGLDRVAGEYVSYVNGHTEATLDGKFTAAELEAIAAYIRKHQSTLHGLFEDDDDDFEDDDDDTR